MLPHRRCAPTDQVIACNLVAEMVVTPKYGNNVTKRVGRFLTPSALRKNVDPLNDLRSPANAVASWNTLVADLSQNFEPQNPFPGFYL